VKEKQLGEVMNVTALRVTCAILSVDLLVEFFRNKKVDKDFKISKSHKQLSMFYGIL